MTDFTKLVYPINNAISPHIKPFLDHIGLKYRFTYRIEFFCPICQSPAALFTPELNPAQGKSKGCSAPNWICWKKNEVDKYDRCHLNYGNSIVGLVKAVHKIDDTETALNIVKDYLALHTSAKPAQSIESVLKEEARKEIMRTEHCIYHFNLDDAIIHARGFNVLIVYQDSNEWVQSVNHHKIGHSVLAKEFGQPEAQFIEAVGVATINVSGDRSYFENVKQLLGDNFTINHWSN